MADESGKSLQEVGKQGEEPAQRKIAEQEEKGVSGLHGGIAPDVFAVAYPNGDQQQLRSQPARATDGTLHAEVGPEGISGVEVHNAVGDDDGEWRHELILSHGNSRRVKPVGNSLMILLGKDPFRICQFEPAQPASVLANPFLRLPYNTVFCDEK